MILRGQDASDATGISMLHAQAFQEAANATKNVIASRAVGKYATGLIAEGYATKGFHNKAKSCNWGPMAGFVLSDPRFTKAKETTGQQQDVEKAIAYGATTVPLYISEQRIRWLQKEALFLGALQGPDRYIGTAAKEGLLLMFMLERDTKQRDLFSVSYRKASAVARGEGSWTPVMALRDSMCSVPKDDYRSATTGDYDLFAVWARTLGFRPESLDKRMVGHAQLEKNIKANLADTGENKHLGNISPRIAATRFELNRRFKRAGYTGGNMVHHSDEGGRPFVDAIDLPIFMVIPEKKEAYCLETVADLKEIIRTELDGKYIALFNPGWMRELNA